MTPEALTIREADLNDERQTLEVVWGDEHRSSYPLKELRSACPCASCRTDREDARANPFHVLKGVPSVIIANVEPVGLYGMRITWKDGHATGIYTFEYLRGLCPCEACRAAPRDPEVPYVHGIYIPR